MAYINRTKQYKKALAASIVGGSAIFCLLGLTLSTKIFWLVLINIAVLGFTAAPILPIAYEYSCEITFPVGEAMAGGLIICLSQLMAGILVKIKFMNQQAVPNFLFFRLLSSTLSMI